MAQQEAARRATEPGQVHLAEAKLTTALLNDGPGGKAADERGQTRDEEPSGRHRLLCIKELHQPSVSDISYQVLPCYLHQCDAGPMPARLPVCSYLGPGQQRNRAPSAGCLSPYYHRHLPLTWRSPVSQVPREVDLPNMVLDILHSEGFACFGLFTLLVLSLLFSTQTSFNFLAIA